MEEEEEEEGEDNTTQCISVTKLVFDKLNVANLTRVAFSLGLGGDRTIQTEGRKEGRKEGRMEARKEVKKEGRKKGRKISR